MKHIPAILLLFFTAWSISSCTAEDPQEMNSKTETLPEGKTAPNFSLSTYDNKTVSLSDYNDEVLVIFFFGNDCTSCKATAPDIEKELHRAYKNHDAFNIIGIDQWDGNTAKVEAFKNKTGVTFPLAVMGSSVAKKYNTTYDRLVVVKDGEITFRGTTIAANDLNKVKKLLDGYFQ